MDRALALNEQKTSWFFRRSFVRFTHNFDTGSELHIRAETELLFHIVASLQKGFATAVSKWEDGLMPLFHNMLFSLRRARLVCIRSYIYSSSYRTRKTTHISCRLSNTSTSTDSRTSGTQMIIPTPIRSIIDQARINCQRSLTLIPML